MPKLSNWRQTSMKLDVCWMPICALYSQQITDGARQATTVYCLLSTVYFSKL